MLLIDSLISFMWGRIMFLVEVKMLVVVLVFIWFLIERIDKAERLLAEAAGYGSQLVVFPEAFVGGYPRGSNFGVTIGSRTAKGKEEFRKYHASAIDVPGKTLCLCFCLCWCWCSCRVVLIECTYCVRTWTWWNVLGHLNFWPVIDQMKVWL